MPAVELSGRASANLLGIYLEGIRLFGPLQADRYLTSIESCLALLAANPRMGRSAEDAGPGLRRHEHGSHVVFCEAVEGVVVIVAVLHARQLPDLGG